MRSKLVIGNWKMHGSRSFATLLVRELVNHLRGVASDVALCVPAPVLSCVVDLTADSRIQVGAQDLSDFDHGAFTGEVSAAMLCDVGCRLVLVGHSERRIRHRETNPVVGRKAQMALANGLMPVVCVGETRQQRDAGQTEAVVLEQIDAVIDQTSAGSMNRMVVAYEPIWAIGSVTNATPGQAQEIHAAIRQHVARRCGKALAVDLRLIYGGSVNATNAAELLEQPDVDGVLVGGASLVAREFSQIAQIAARCASRYQPLPSPFLTAGAVATAMPPQRLSPSG